MKTITNMAWITTTSVQRFPMSAQRKTSLAAGVLYLLTFVSIPTLSLYGHVKGPNYILSAGPDTSGAQETR